MVTPVFGAACMTSIILRGGGITFLWLLDAYLEVLAP